MMSKFIVEYYDTEKLRRGIEPVKKIETDNLSITETEDKIIITIDNTSSKKAKALAKLTYADKVALGLITEHDSRDGTMGLNIDYSKGR